MSALFLLLQVIPLVHPRIPVTIWNPTAEVSEVSIVQGLVAQKMNKNDSIFRLDGYLHPNPNHAFPKWHERAGQPGSPRLFVSTRCKFLRKEIPQMRWRKKKGAENFENELDPQVERDHSYHALLYMTRELPKPTDLQRSIADDIPKELDLMSRMLQFEKRAREAQKRRDLWNARMGHGRQRRRSRFGIPAEILEAVNQ